MNHRESMARKITALRESDAVAELQRRWEDADEDPPFATYEILELADPAEPARDLPGGLGDFHRLAASASFGHIVIEPEDAVRTQRAVDSLGSDIEDHDWLRIGDIGYEDALLMDPRTGSVIVYFDQYFKHGWDSPVVIRCADVPEFIDTVALGPGYQGILGPVDKQRAPWWESDPWYAYLRETGLAPAED